MILRQSLLLAAAILAASSTPLVHAEGPLPSAALPASPSATAPARNPADRYLFEDQIHPGMKGYGLTVMSGGKIEKFQVEVIDVVKNFTPGNNAILVRCSGLGLEHSGIIAGMSGSPVFLDDKMIGAIAYGWGMAKDPIAGVQPIRQMLAVQPPKSAPGAAEQPQGAATPWTAGNFLARQAALSPRWKALAANLAKHSGAKPVALQQSPASTPAPQSMRPLASPLMVSGLSASSLNLLANELQGTGLVPVESGSGTGSLNRPPGDKNLGGIAALKPGDIHLEPGAALAIPLVTGDMDLSAIGTVTEVADGKVYAFGHAFLAQGTTDLPIATSYIYTVMPNVSESFKMGTSLAPAGTLQMDEQTGIMGKIGPAPKMVPVTVSIKNPDESTRIYHYQMSPHPKLTPLILNSMLNETLVAQRNLPAQFTAHLTGQVTFAAPPGAEGKEAAEPITLHIDTLGTTDSFKAPDALLPILILADNPFENMHIASLNFEASIDAVNHAGQIQSVTVDRTTVAPGDEIRATASIVPFQKDPSQVPLTIKIPADAPDGDYELSVGSSAMALMQESQYAPQHFDPQDITALRDAVNRIEAYKSDHLYATLVLELSGAAVAGQEKQNLPVSRLALYAGSRRTDTSPIMRVVKQDADAGAVLADGGQTFTIHIDHRADHRYYSAKPNDSHEAAPDRHPSIPLTAPATAESPDKPNDDPGN